MWWVLSMKNPADVRTLGICFAKMVILFAVWHQYPSLGLAGRGFAMFVQFLSAFFVATMVHNAMHCDVFGHPLVEYVWRFTLTTMFGFPVEAYRPTHNANHHVFTQHEEDHLHTSQMKYRWHLLNLLMFFPTVYPGITKLENAYIAKEFEKRSWAFVRFAIQVVCSHGFTLSLLWADWRRCLLCWLIPNVLAADAIVTMNMLQHDDCEHIVPGEPRGQKMNIDMARNFVGPVINWLSCNNGYHTIHHMMPNTHWSQYPALHKKLVVPTMDPRLDEQCIVRFLFRQYLWPGVLPENRRKALIAAETKEK